jgi:hypothetical protein
VTQEAVPDELLYNERYSLLFEGGHRWTDLRRYGRLETLPLDLPQHRRFDKFPFPQFDCDTYSPQPPKAASLRLDFEGGRPSATTLESSLDVVAPVGGAEPSLSPRVGDEVQEGPGSGALGESAAAAERCSCGPRLTALAAGRIVSGT